MNGHIILMRRDCRSDEIPAEIKGTPSRNSMLAAAQNGCPDPGGIYKYVYKQWLMSDANDISGVRHELGIYIHIGIMPS